MERRIKTECVGNETASMAKLTALNSDKEVSNSSDDEDKARENKSARGLTRILYGGYSASTRVMVSAEEVAMDRGREVGMTSRE